MLQQLEVTRHFSRQIAVPAVRSYEELKDIVKARNADRFFGSQSVSSEEVIWRLAQQTGRRQVGVGVKLIMEALAESEIASEPATNFINEISRLMAEMSPEEVNVSREVRVSK